MTHYFYYVVAGQVCDGTTQPYKVGIGHSAQGQRDHAFLASYAKEHGHYFSPITQESDIFFRHLLESLEEFDVSSAQIAGRDLVRLLKDGVSKPLSSAQLHAADYQLKMLDTSYRIISNLNRRAASSAKRSTSKT